MFDGGEPESAHGNVGDPAEWVNAGKSLLAMDSPLKWVVVALVLLGGTAWVVIKLRKAFGLRKKKGKEAERAVIPTPVTTVTVNPIFHVSPTFHAPPSVLSHQPARVSTPAAPATVTVSRRDEKEASLAAMVADARSRLKAYRNIDTSDLAVDDLHRILEEHTEAQSRELVAEHIGKRIVVAGSVINVTVEETTTYLERVRPGSASVMLITGFGAGVSLAFPESDGGRLRLVKKGSPMIAVGTIHRCTSRVVWLTECEVIDG